MGKLVEWLLVLVALIALAGIAASPEPRGYVECRINGEPSWRFPRGGGSVPLRSLHRERRTSIVSLGRFGAYPARPGEQCIIYPEKRS